MGMHPFIYLPLCLYLVFMGLYLQQGLMTLFLARGGLVRPASYQASFVFASAVFCGSLICVLISPQLGLSGHQTRIIFFGSWCIAPLVGFLYVSTLAAHLEIDRGRIRWITIWYLLDFVSTVIAGLITWITGRPILFSHEQGEVQSIIDLHLGGAFSPNSFTAVKVVLLSLLVVTSTSFFIKEILKKKTPDRFLLTGVSLTGVAIIIELVSYLSQWSFAFSLLPLVNVIEVIRLTHLQTITAGRTIERSRQKVSAARDQLGAHLVSLVHDVRTPLASLKVGLTRLDLSHSHQKTAAALGTELEYLDVVFSNLVALYELELVGDSPLRRDLDIRNVLGRCADKFTQLAREQSVTLHTSDEEEPLIASFSPSGIDQALNNLTFSSILHAEANVAISTFIDGADVIIRIQDDGPVGARTVIPHLSDRRYRDKLQNGRRTPNWGLALSISREIITGHGGALTVAIDADELLTVEIRLNRVCLDPDLAQNPEEMMSSTDIRPSENEVDRISAP